MSSAEETAALVQVYFVDTGQGDCTLLVDRSNGSAVIIDCHPKAKKRVLEILHNEEIELVLAFITHFHLDHYGAVAEVLSNAPGPAVRYNPPLSMPADRNQQRRLRSVLRTLRQYAKGPQSDITKRGDSGSIGEISWTCLAPDLGLLTSASSESDPNKASIVLVVTLQGLSILITGDADGEVFTTILADPPGTIDVLRVPHHGARLDGGGPTASEVIQALSPQILVVSVGTRNSYGHPDDEWLSLHNRSRIMCTEATRRCDAHLADSQVAAPCAGDVVISWWKSGEWTVVPDQRTHAVRIDQFSRPACRPVATRRETQTEQNAN